MAEVFQGLEDDYFCVHTPTIIKVQEEIQHPIERLEVSIHSLPENEHLMFFSYSNPDENNSILFDLSPWIKMLMPKFLNNTDYDTGINDQTQKTKDSEYIKRFSISMVMRDKNGADQTASYGKNFVHCSNGNVLKEDDSKIRIWEGYPFSYQRGLETLVYGIMRGTPDTQGRPFEFISDYAQYIKLCGTYVKWLNEFGYFNYWLFHNSEKETEAEELFRVNRDIYKNAFRVDQYGSLNNTNAREDTVGFDKKTTYNLKDLIPKEYWHLFDSLTASPEVYVLREDWNPQESTVVTHEDWYKVVQDFDFERDRIRKNKAEVSVKLEISKQYTQKYI